MIWEPHFIVTPSEVRTLRGRVRVLDLQDHELAVLVPGESWTVAGSPSALRHGRPAAGPAAVAPAIAPRPEECRRPSPTPAVHEHAATRTRPPSVAQLLARGRAAMSEGDADGARAWIARARETAPTEDEAAALDFLEADAWLVTKQPDAAIAAYRRVARAVVGTAQAETATFAVGQLLVEGDSAPGGGDGADGILGSLPAWPFRARGAGAAGAASSPRSDRVRRGASSATSTLATLAVLAATAVGCTRTTELFPAPYRGVRRPRSERAPRRPGDGGATGASCARSAIAAGLGRYALCTCNDLVVTGNLDVGVPMGTGGARATAARTAAAALVPHAGRQRRQRPGGGA